MKKYIRINNKIIGLNTPCFVIAEAGINHNGKLHLAKKLVDIAIESNADAIKFQTYKSQEVVLPNVKNAKYAKNNYRKNYSQLEMIRKFELSYDDFVALKNYSDKKGIIFLSSPHSYDAIDFLADLVPAFKFGSGDITNIPALSYAATKGKPIILSTGMSTISEIKEAIKYIKKEQNNNIVLLHCTTSYPCPYNEINLRAIITMRRELDCLIGYSDHSLGITVPIMAVTLGAVMIEKHITLSNNLVGPDHKASLEPKEFKRMVLEIRKSEQALGSFKKVPTLTEKKTIAIVRKSIVSISDIEINQIITQNMIGVKRPGYGIEPKFINKVIGKRANKKIFKNSLIMFSDIK